jgi:hypothetical protein
MDQVAGEQVPTRTAAWAILAPPHRQEGWCFMVVHSQPKWFDAVRLDDGRELASANGSTLPTEVFEAALLAHLTEDCSVAIRADGDTILQINSRMGHDCCDRESDPDLQPVDLRVNPKGWSP